jgi:hypothetical protein
MRKLTYWYAQCLDDSDCYSIRERTRKLAVDTKRNREADGGRYGPVVKITIEYENPLDLLQMATSEGGIWQEYKGHCQATEAN